MEINNAIERFTSIQEEINRLVTEAVDIVKDHLDDKACPKWHTKILIAVKNMEGELDDLEDEAIEQEEVGLGKEVLDFCRRYPQEKLSDIVKEEMDLQGFSIKETPFLIIVGTLFADYPFDKKTGEPLQLPCSHI